jgi:hypothetical protein
MDDADRFIATLNEAGIPASLEQADYFWEVALELEGKTALLARAKTRRAAVDRAGRELLPLVVLQRLRAFSRQGQVRFEAASALETIKRAAEILGGFGWFIRFRREPEGAWSWGVIDEKTGEAIVSDAVTDWDDAKVSSILDLLPPNLVEVKEFAA